MLNETAVDAARFSSFSDEQLCRMAAEGDRSAEEALLVRYYGIVRILVRPLSLAGGDAEDLIQEGMFGLFCAIHGYQADKSASFHTFAEVCIRHQLISALRSDACDNNTPLNQSVPLDSPFFDCGSSASCDFPMKQVDPEEVLLDQDRLDRLLRETRKQLSRFEAKVFGYYLDGLTCQEIARAVGRSPKSVDNAVQRIRRKVARLLNSGEFSRS